jgi:hypothetical protein
VQLDACGRAGQDAPLRALVRPWWAVVAVTVVAVVSIGGPSSVSAGTNATAAGDPPAASASSATSTSPMTSTVPTTAVADLAAGAGTSDASTIPCDEKSAKGMVPSQVGGRYDLTPLWDRGFTGQGVRVAVIESGTSIDASVLARYEKCRRIAPVPYSALFPAASGLPSLLVSAIDVGGRGFEHLTPCPAATTAPTRSQNVYEAFGDRPLHVLLSARRSR